MPDSSTTAQSGFKPAAELAFYLRHLNTALLPFWLNRSVDEEYGGFYTCFDNEGRNMLSQDKFTWSQGRIVWIWAKLAGMPQFSTPERTRFVDLARSGAQFLMKHCLLPNGNCTFLMTRDGAAKEQGPDIPLDSSVYADCFVVLGLSRYASVSRDRTALDFAYRLYQSINARVQSGSFNSQPYPIPAGHKTHGIPMILLNTSQEMAAGLAALGLAEESGSVRQTADGYLHQVLGFVAPSGEQHEFIASDGRFMSDTLLGRYVNPGHGIEDMWFVIHQVLGSSDAAFATRTISTASKVITRAFELGWDSQYGGLLLYVDQEGGQPRGSSKGMENDTMVRKVSGDWGNKLWWVHSEALYSTLLALRLSGDNTFLSLYRKAFEYTFRVFPNPDPAIGEWIQIRDRQGRAEQKVVALPVKDPFHIIRNVALVIDLLSTWDSRTPFVPL